MKILYDHGVFQFQRYGGISRYFYELITRLSTKEDVGINLFQGIHINEYRLSKERYNLESYFGHEWRYKKHIAKYLLYGLFPIPHKLLLNDFMKPLDLDIFHPTYYRTDLKRSKDYKIVLTVHDMIHELYPNEFIDSGLVIKAKKKSINAADMIICVSENTKKDLINIYNVPDNKIRVVYHGNSFPKDNTYLTSTDLKQRYSIVNSYILYVGDRKRRYKNFEIVLKAYLSSFSHMFDLICFGGGDFSQNELRLITKFGCTNRVHSLSGSDFILGSLYKHAFCLVYPSLYEGFGIPLLEAMALGCPIITSNTSSIPEVVGNAAITFDPFSEQDLIDKIGLLTYPEVRDSLITLGLKQEQNFSWDKAVHETYSIYQELL